MNSLSPENLAHLTALLNQWVRTTVREEIRKEFDRRFGKLDREPRDETVKEDGKAGDGK